MCFEKQKNHNWHGTKNSNMRARLIQFCLWSDIGFLKATNKKNKAELAADLFLSHQRIWSQKTFLPSTKFSKNKGCISEGRVFWKGGSL